MLKPFSMLMQVTTCFIVLPKGMIMDFTFKECLAITLVRSDKKIKTIQHVKSQLIVSIKDLYGKFNIRLTYSCLLLFASVRIIR